MQTFSLIGPASMQPPSPTTVRRCAGNLKNYTDWLLHRRDSWDGRGGRLVGMKNWSIVSSSAILIASPIILPRRKSHPPDRAPDSFSIFVLRIPDPQRRVHFILRLLRSSPLSMVIDTFLFLCPELSLTLMFLSPGGIVMRRNRGTANGELDGETGISFGTRAKMIEL